jgi:hypothetical protein
VFLLFCEEIGFFPVIRGPLWLSPIVYEIGEGASKQTSPPLIETPHQSGKEPSGSSQRVTVETLSRKGSRIVCLS